jgi:YidC/Oxa1 family membrane protein insertase
VNFFDVILWPIKWLIEAILVVAHNFLGVLGLDPVSGVSWVLAIALLVVVVRAAMIPLFLHQVRSGKRMRGLSSQVQAIQEKYKGKSDALSRQKQSEEMMALYKEAGTGPFSFLASSLIQAPIFISLYAVLSHAARTGDAGVGWLTARLATEFNVATFFGASLHGSFVAALSSGLSSATLVLVPVIIVVMITAQYFTLRWSSAAGSLNEPVGQGKNVMRVQYGALVLFSLIFVFSGAAFPLSLLVYMLFSTLWTAGQQFIYLQVEKHAAERAADEAEVVE